MKGSFKKAVLKIRRYLLSFVPEFLWPKEVFIDGVGIPIRNTPYSFGTRWILCKGTYEVSERKLIEQFLKPGSIVFEMGGSIGVLTAIMSKIVGTSGRVISVEASDDLTSFSRQWLEKKGNTKILTGYGFPVFEGKSLVKINSFDKSLGSLGGIVSFELNANVDENISDDKVKVYDIRQIAEQFQINPDVLVIDIEGSETLLLNVAPQLPLSVKHVLIELHPHLYGLSVMNSIINRINVQGFNIMRQEGDVYLFDRERKVS